LVSIWLGCEIDDRRNSPLVHSVAPASIIQSSTDYRVPEESKSRK
jgi:hypothetical protein